MTWTTIHTDHVLHNVHERITDGPIDAAERLLANVGSEDDTLWPSDRWPSMILDDGHTPGSSGGHGPIRYAVETAEPRRVRFRFPDGDPTGSGWHELRVEPFDDRVRWVHELHVTQPPATLTSLIIPLHDALIEDCFDQATAILSGGRLTRRPLPPGVRIRRAVMAAIGVSESGEDRARRRPIAWATAGVLVGIGALHAAWGLGSTWPVGDERRLTRAVLGSPTQSAMPGPVPCWAAAAALTLTAGLAVARVSDDERLRTVGHVGTRGAAAVLGLRAAFGLVQSGLFPQTVTPEFRRRDLAAYSPLCAGLAAGLWSLGRP